MNQHDELFIKAIKTWGVHAQEMMVIEECSELIKAICKYRRKAPAATEFENIIDEVADVTIMARQMAIMVGVKEVEKRINFKIEKLKERLNATSLSSTL